MILVLNIGNSHISVGGFDSKGSLSFSGSVKTDHQKTDLEYVTAFLRLFEEEDVPLSDIEGGALSCVVPDLRGIVKTALKRLFSFEFVEVNADFTPGFQIAMEDPRILGANLIADTTAAVREHEAPLLILDLGNSTSVGVIDRDARYLGGLLLPGVMGSLRALVGNTALLPSVDLSAPGEGIGKNTVEAIRRGVIFGNAGMIDGVIDRVIRENSESLAGVKILATGRLATLIRPFLKHEVLVDETLTLKGLYFYFLSRKEAEL